MTGAVRDIPLHHISLPANIPAGLSPFVLFAIVHTLRNGYDAGHGPGQTEPIDVRGTDGDYVVSEGRHRFIAHYIAGKPSARCVVITP